MPLGKVILCTILAHCIHTLTISLAPALPPARERECPLCPCPWSALCLSSYDWSSLWRSSQRWHLVVEGHCVCVCVERSKCVRVQGGQQCMGAEGHTGEGGNVFMYRDKHRGATKVRSGGVTECVWGSQPTDAPLTLTWRQKAPPRRGSHSELWHRSEHRALHLETPHRSSSSWVGGCEPRVPRWTTGCPVGEGDSC